jgi:hypothetical protein
MIFHSILVYDFNESNRDFNESICIFPATKLQAGFGCTSATLAARSSGSRIAACSEFSPRSWF